jgi:hypothetical protein
LFVTRPESGEDVGHLIVTSEDMIKFKTVKLLLKLSYLLAVCIHARVVAIRLPHDLVDDELRVTKDAAMRRSLTRASYSSTFFVAWKCSRIT